MIIIKLIIKLIIMIVIIEIIKIENNETYYDDYYND